MPRGAEATGTVVPEEEATSSVKTAGRTLDVFEAFAAIGEPLSLTELAARIDAPLSSCHALVKTLQARGYLYPIEQRRSFYPSRRLYDVASEIARRDPLLQQILPVMTALRDATGETVIAGKRQGNEVVYLLVVEGTHIIRYREHPGSKKPLHSSAIGKAVLGSLDERALGTLLRTLRLPRMTEGTIVDVEALRADLRQSVERGYFRTRGENVAEVEAVALPFRLSGELIALAIAGPIERMRTREAAYVEALRAQVAKLGGALPHPA
jgi:IclR family transcriptional regulator, acetate operon repressor